jgi:hypothetical protein
MLARSRKRLTTKIRSKNNLYPHRHFTFHLVGAFGKLPPESNLNKESSSLLIRRLKNHTDSSLQTDVLNQKVDTAFQALRRTLCEHKDENLDTTAQAMSEGPKRTAGENFHGNGNWGRWKPMQAPNFRDNT